MICPECLKPIEMNHVFPREEWTEDNGIVLWWFFPISEPPFLGTPFDENFPDWVTHWTPLIVPKNPENHG